MKFPKCSSYKFGYYVTKLSGYIFFTVKYSSNIVKFQRRFYDYLIFLASFIFSFLVTTSSKQNFTLELSSTILNIGMRKLLQFSAFFLMVTKFVNFVGARKAFQIIDIFHQFDKKVWKFSNHFWIRLIYYKFLLQIKISCVEEKSHKLLITAILIISWFLVSTLILVFCSFAFNNEAENATNLTPLTLSTIIILSVNSVTYQSFVIVQMLIIYLVYLRLVAIDDFLKQPEANGKVLNTEIILNKVKIAAILVDKICDALEAIKVCYTMNNIYYILSYSFYTIFFVYGVASYCFAINSSRMELTFTLMSLVWNTYYAPFIIWLFVFGNRITKAGKNIEDQLQIILVRNFKETAVCKKTTLVFMQISHRRPIITCGIFNIDWYFLFCVIGICFSYVVIIVQFELKSFDR